jgi:hypothetical protein
MKTDQFCLGLGQATFQQSPESQSGDAREEKVLV